MESSNTESLASSTLHILGMDFDIPPRSRLYSPPPQGLGTPYVESLTGYITRLAEEHCLYPGKLITLEILPVSEGRFLSGPRPEDISTHLIRTGSGCNGLGDLARIFVQALEELTLRKGLRALTLLRWGRLLAWEGLLRRTRAWCPACYTEQLQAGAPVYDQLLWTLDVVSVCLKHQRTLEIRCPHEECGRTMPVLTARTRPGWCSRCGRWLGLGSRSGYEATLGSGSGSGLGQPHTPLDSLDTAEGIRGVGSANHSTETGVDLVDTSGPPGVDGGLIGIIGPKESPGANWRWQMWVASAMGELLAGAATLESMPASSNISATLSACLRKLGYPGLRAFCTSRSIEYATARGWNRGAHLPPIGPLLRICYSLGTTPFRFLVEGVGIAESVVDNVEGLRSVPQARKRELKPQFDEEYVGRYLEGVLGGNEYPPPSMREVGKRLGYMPYSLKRYFLQECLEITARHRAYLAERRSAREQQLKAEVRGVVLRLLKDGEYPSRRKVARLLSKSGNLLSYDQQKVWRKVLNELGFR